MATYENQESLPYILEAINDLQTRFYGLQLEQLKNQEKMQQLPSLNSIWSTSSGSACGSTRPPSTGSAASSVDRDSGNSSIRSFSPDVSSASAQHYSTQLNAAAALWPQAAAAASLAAFLPKQQNQLNAHLLQNVIQIQKNHQKQQNNIVFGNDADVKFSNFEQINKKHISPIGSGIPKKQSDALALGAEY